MPDRFSSSRRFGEGEEAGAFGEQEGRDADPVGATDVDPGQAEQGRRPQDIEKGGIEVRIECQ